MRRVAVGTLLVLGLAMALLAAACAPSPTEGERTPRAGTPGAAIATARAGTPGAAVATARAGTPGTPGMMTTTPVAGTPGAMTPTAQVMGQQATPGPSMAQALINDMEQFRNQLQQLASGTPTPSDMVNMVQRASVLMSDLSQEIPQMTMQERERALGTMSDVMGEMAQVVETHARQVAAMGTPVPMAAAAPVTPTPVGTVPTAATFADQVMRQLDGMRARMMELAADQPTHEDLIDLMDEMQGLLLSMRQNLGQLSEQELEGLTSDMATALDDLTSVMETFVRQQTEASPMLTPSPTMLP